MVWTKEHYLLLVQEVLVTKPFNFKHGSRERGNAGIKLQSLLM